jgi:ribosomal protein S12 methylthiotransferase accessory factor YcaO-like protein
LHDSTRASPPNRRRGIDVLVLDQTRPDVGLPVVRVIMSSMRHYWARLAPGRLYDVPAVNRSLSACSGMPGAGIVFDTALGLDTPFPFVGAREF